MKALLDGDILVYRCAFAAEKTLYLAQLGPNSWQEYNAHKDIPKEIPKRDIWSRKEVEPEESALQATRATIQSILRELGTEDYELYLSGTESFRERIAVTKKYKGNRDGQARPVHYSAVRGLLISEFNAQVCMDGLEADDMLGIRATELGDSSVVVSIDKDLLQIPGRHYNWVSGTNVVVSSRDGAMALGCQILSGDPTDNVPGLPGIGPGKAEKAIGHATSTKHMLECIRRMYRDYSGGDERGAENYLREQGSLVYILKSRDDSFDKWMEKYAA